MECLVLSFLCAFIILEMCVKQVNAYFTTTDINLNCVYYSKYPGIAGIIDIGFFLPLCKFDPLNFVVDGLLSFCIFLEI